LPGLESSPFSLKVGVILTVLSGLSTARFYSLTHFSAIAIFRPIGFPAKAESNNGCCFFSG
jgi:hypothetical protein